MSTTALNTKEVHVQYFAVLREERGLSSETLTTAAVTFRQLYEELAGLHGFRLPCDKMRVAIDDRFRNWDDILDDGSTVLLIPPVAGG